MVNYSTWKSLMSMKNEMGNISIYTQPGRSILTIMAYTATVVNMCHTLVRRRSFPSCSGLMHVNAIYILYAISLRVAI